MITASLQLVPIGKVLKKNGEPTKISIDTKYREGMQHLDKFSHLLIFWWASKCDNLNDRQVLTVQIPQDRFPDAPKSGVFSSRSPAPEEAAEEYTGRRRREDRGAKPL